MCPELQHEALLQDAGQESAALGGGRNSLPSRKLLRDATVGFYATKTNSDTSNHKWLFHT